MAQETGSTQQTPEARAKMQAEGESAETHSESTATHHVDVPKSEVFSHLLGELGDHHQFSWFNFHADLPIIIMDGGKFHTYGSEHSMEEAGMFRLDGHHIVRASTGQLPNEKPKSVDLDLSITNLVVFEWIAIIVVLILGKLAAGKYKKNPNKAPSGFQNAWEALTLYICSEIIYPNVPSKPAAKRLTPYFLSLFFFILFSNLIGLLPGAHATTGAVGVTAALAITAFFVVNYTAIREAGFKSWAHHLLGGAPWWLFPIMVPIEIVGLFTKPFALTVRLFANMTAGHIVILSLVGLIFFFKTIFVAPVSVAFSIFIYTLELLVAFLQAYVFTILTAVFVGLAIGHSHHEDHEGAQHI